MEKYNTNHFRSGLKVLLEGEPCTIVSNEFIKPGKGQAFSRVKLRNLKTGRILDKTFKSGESLHAADVLEVSMQYLYSDAEQGYFMHPETFDQLSIKNSIMDTTQKWLKPQDIYTVTLYNNNAIGIEAQNFVALKVIETDLGVKGDTAQGGSKPATLETGAVVRVPLFVSIDDTIKIDTRTGEYVSRAKTT